jgi:hypothetical protein
MTAPRTVILYNKANEFGLKQDAELLQKTLTCELRDPLEPASPCDIAIHLEVPYYGWMSFASINVFMINPEWWEDVWNPYLTRADLLVFKCEADKDRFLASRSFAGKALVIPWACLPYELYVKEKKDVLWLLGASVNKREAALKVLPLWQGNWPQLNVYTTTPFVQDLYLQPNVKIHIGNLAPLARRNLQQEHACHLIFSAAEALGVSALEGEACGAFLIGNALPTYAELFKDASYAHLTPAKLEPYKAGVKDSFNDFEQGWLQAGVDKFLTRNEDNTFLDAMGVANQRLVNFRSAVQTLNTVSPTPNPIYYLADEELPKISVITLLYNRKSFIDLAFKNILTSDYPKEKIEWVVVDDSDDPEHQCSDKIIKFGRENGPCIPRPEGAGPLTLTYIPLAKRTIGRKRNVGINRSEHDIILFMDDDDYYPPSSFRRRVSSLLTHSWKPAAAVCTTIACYDLVRGVSAVNTPPWSLGLSKRISEATLTFHKSFWAEKNFPNVNMAEGEGFLEGRESQVLELPPQQIIVAMSHGKNMAGRRIPDGPPSCFWGFSKEMLTFLHKLAGVEVE